jgi:hypothetical protein
MTQGRFAGRGRNAGRNGRGSANGQRNGQGRGTGYTSKANTKNVGMCAELHHHIFNYGVANAADLMRTTQEKIAQFVGSKFGEDIANELTNKVAVIVPPPQYSAAIKTRHQEWEKHVRSKQTRVRAALTAKLGQLQAAVPADVVEIADVENQIEDIVYQQGKDVPYNLTKEEELEFSNESKSHSYRVATLEKHRGQVYALIYGQCTQVLQDKMKQDKGWPAVSVSYNPLSLYKLMERVIMKQTEDQYPVAALWEQLCNVTQAKQGNMTNIEYYERLNTKIDVAESVGVSFDFERIWEYCAQETHKQSYSSLTSDKQALARSEAKERVLSYALIVSSSNQHKKIKEDLSNDFTKGEDYYPRDRSQALMMMDHYSKSPTAVVVSEGTSFAQTGKKKKGDKDKPKTTDKDPKEFNKEYWKDKECYRCGKKGHPATACTVKPLKSEDDDDKSKSGSNASKEFREFQSKVKKAGTALAQLGETDFDDNLFEEQSHAQLGIVEEVSNGYSFAAKSKSISHQLLLDNQSSVHIMCNQDFVSNIRKSAHKMVLVSNGGRLPLSKVADFAGFETETWFSTDAMTNILSFRLVRCEYEISYDGHSFIIHRAVKGFPDMVFKPHNNGLYVYDPDDPRGMASRHCFMETVENNMALFSQRQLKDAIKVRNLQAGLAFPSDTDLKWALQSNVIKDCPLSVADLRTATTVYGKSIAMLKGKTVKSAPPVVRQNIMEIPKEIRVLHKKVTLCIDVFFVNKTPFFLTYSLVICFLSVTHLTGQKAPDIFKALKAMCNYYLQHGFQVVFIKGDGAFKPLQEYMDTVYGAPQLNTTSANEHEPTAERKIRLIKERARAIIHSIPFNALPEMIIIHMVLFVAKQLNLFPVKGGLSAQLSPRQIMTGEVADYKNCNMGFGQYCQIHEEDQPRNSMKARTQGAISLGPSGNVQGGHKFYTLANGTVVTRRAWTELPTPKSAIERIHVLAQGMPAMPVFTDRRGRVIGDAIDYELYDDDDDDDNQPPVGDEELPGVHTDETGGDFEIPGVDPVQQELEQAPTTPAETEQEVDLDFAPSNESNEDPPIVISNDPPAAPAVNPDDGNRRSTRIRTQTKPAYIPSMTGKKYSFATTVLGSNMLGDEAYEYNQEVTYSFMQQLSVKAALTKWGDDAAAAGEKEVSQLEWRETFVPKRMSDLTTEQKGKILQSHMFVVKKRDGVTKARIVAGGNQQRGHVTKEESSSPTVSTESVLLTSIVDAHEGREVAVIDIPNAYIQTHVDDPKDRVIIRITGVVADWLVKAAPKVYEPYVIINKRGEKSLLVECHNAIYGTMVAGLLYYRKFTSSLKVRGFEMNPYDPCVWNKTIKGKQLTICFHVDDCKISHVNVRVVDYTIDWLRTEYESIFTDGSGKMKVARGKVHTYVGMTLDFTESKIVKVTMFAYIDEIVQAWDKACSEIKDGCVVSGRKRIATAAPDDLFKVDEDAMKLDQAQAKAFHNLTAKMIYVAKRARPDISLAVAFLTTRVKGPDIDDWRKLRHVIEYLRVTRDLPLILGADGSGVLSWYVDASFAVHPDMRGHTGGAMTMGRGCPLNTSTKHKLNSRNSTESEIIAVDNLIPQILWTRLFMKAQGIEVRDNILYQDNKSAVLLETNGRASSSKRTKHINIRYYYVADRVAKGDLRIVWCPTDKMIADFLTKPLQGKAFVDFRNLLMGVV